MCHFRSVRNSAIQIVALALCSAIAHAQQNVLKPEASVLSTGVTGSIHASGLDNPQYVLSFVPVQRLLLRSIRQPLTVVEVESGLQGTPVTLDVLLKLGLLRRDGEILKLNYLILTVSDQRKLYREGIKYGHGLASAFLAHQHEFDELSKQYPSAQLRSEVMFCLIAGVALNWDGLRLSTDLGYRIRPPRAVDGSVGFVHSSEIGAQLDFTGLYWDSQSVATRTLGFATFGDGETWPRLYGLPDMFDGVSAAVSAWRKDTDVYAALRKTYSAYTSIALDDAAQILNAVADGHTSEGSMAESVSIPENRRIVLVKLLVTSGYLTNVDGHYVIAAPFLSDKDKVMVDKILTLSRQIMTEWLRANFENIRSDLSDLSPLANGIPFQLVFSEVWHYDFAFAAKELAQSGFFVNPSDPKRRDLGYVPLVWSIDLFETPGT